MSRSIVASLSLVTALSCALLIPSLAHATKVNYAMAQNPSAVIAEVNKIGVTLPDAQASEVRGEGWKRRLTRFVLRVISPTI